MQGLLYLIFSYLARFVQRSHNQALAAAFSRQVLEEWPYTIECSYSDNGTGYMGKQDHDFAVLSKAHGIGQRFMGVKRPQTNGKAELVLKTLIEEAYSKHIFDSRMVTEWLLRGL
ncbi:MAG: hypothetical protein QS748_02140 [Candidatus Endonucleobacter bathymodioli]|uniref:Integrase catalytic domain-containing protein n=1 Tax=Candidatus Endonucleibacter bathymodioli TaxID=539814 RepID=A0AA90NJV7_9GAMM|nr:hypothetical protein [Candidatus Endonucleobacter bathymodioli]